MATWQQGALRSDNRQLLLRVACEWFDSTVHRESAGRMELTSSSEEKREKGADTKAGVIARITAFAGDVSMIGVR